MKIYFAPMEGITGYIFRNAYNRYYGGVDKYFSPFISPADHCAMNPKEKRDVLPEHNENIDLVPQILANRSLHFITCARLLLEMGYRELNLNLGCPSGTVVSKKKGSGFLTEYDALMKFLDEIYDFASKEKIQISIKTRIGRYDPEEFYDLIDIYNQFPVSELIIHPRIRDDYYKEKTRIEFYKYGVEHSINPCIYNGNIYTVDDLKTHESETAVMLGRGLLYQPQLLLNYKEQGEFDLQRFADFHNELYFGYREIMSPDIHVIYHLKGLWVYWKDLFPGKERVIKKIMKSKKYAEYESFLRELSIDMSKS